ncbi:RUS family member 1 isoform X2 [Prorops nasuta]|uniref:RUS family member 1 isoform X2 n=1 Tax=Prorops nasuta TaxID=863751 RepID=UPI0034CEA070
MQDELIFKEYCDNVEKLTFVIKEEDKVSFKKPVGSRISIKAFYYYCFSILKDIFLPQGFPNSVHHDYVPYQIWDTVQAFASTIMGTLTTHSIMKGVGVGESAATPLAAAITWILKDGTGMIGRIIFAWWNGTALDGQCKKWRLFADILNDIAMGIELLIPYFSSHSVFILCITSAMKSVVGVAGGATRAALTQHQALQNNLADVSAKDGSQETCVNLVASFFGIFFLRFYHDGKHVFHLYFFLVAIHIFANYSAIKSLCLNSLNEDRLAAILKYYFITGSIPSPEKINKTESVLLFQKPVRDLCGFDVRMGISFSEILKRKLITLNQIKYVWGFFQNQNYLIFSNLQKRTIYVVLNKNVEQTDLLNAYCDACICGIFLCMTEGIHVDCLLRSNTNTSSAVLNHIFLYVQHSENNINFLRRAFSLEMDKNIHCIVNTLAISEMEYPQFFDALKEKWNINNIYLPTSQWRYSWS